MSAECNAVGGTPLPSRETAGTIRGVLENQLFLAGIALGIGFLAGVLLFVPFVALSYRRRGRLELGRTLLWAAALVYFWAIWTFTLLPLPTPGEFQCAGTNLQLLQMRQDITAAIDRNQGINLGLLSDVAILQLVLNVVLFLPLGFFLRVLANRGVVIATLTGLATSLFVEVTQLTGVWGLYSCAYRVFDVDDLLVNTLGALLGSILALMIPGARSRRVPEEVAARPQSVTRTRRLIAMICDLLTYTLVTFVLAGLIRLVMIFVLDERDLALDTDIATQITTAVVFALYLVIVLATGRTPGDFAVELRYHGGPVPRLVARPLRFIAGIGGYALLQLLGWDGIASLFTLLSLAVWIFTAHGRGLPGLLSGQRLSDSREMNQPVEPEEKVQSVE